MDPAIPQGNITQQKDNSDPTYRQRGGAQVNQDPDLSQADSAHRGPISLYQGAGGPGVDYNQGDKGQGQPCGPIHKTPIKEYNWALEAGEFHWLDSIQWE